MTKKMLTMKKLTTYLFTALLIVAFTSCDFLDKFDHFGAGNTFDESFTVTVDENDPDFTGTVEFAATDDETIKENIDRISDYKLNKLSFVIDSYNGPSSSVGNGQFSFSSLGTPVGSPIVISNVNFAQLAASGEEFEIPITDAFVLAVGEAYLNNQTLTVEASGSISDLTEAASFDFTVYLSIEARIDVKDD